MENALRLFDAHCHLQDPRLPSLPPLLRCAQAAGVQAWVVNGTREADWQTVASLPSQFPGIRTAFGLHPWWQKERSPDWEELLRRHLIQDPSASLGETGLDRWMPHPDLPDQIDVLQRHLHLAREFHRPLSLHCLKAWPELQHVLLPHLPLPENFLLHSYGAAEEMGEFWVEAGAYFSFSPGFLHPRKADRRRLFSQLPLHRILLETDAPDMAPPPEIEKANLLDREGKRLNHPANLALCLLALAEDRHLPPEHLAEILWENSLRFFKLPSSSPPQAP